MKRKRSAWQFCSEMYLKHIGSSGRLVCEGDKSPGLKKPIEQEQA
jgi:hypothetical protein